ncbi:hypothetical protein ACIBQX_07855 [Nonomuraea sp. NPDC049714]|uniref:hypothetical protein n=1 Tax=Nonomuraea sp. NPDC049714 TaxID=3364357 RepID=UPI0037881E93
MPVVVRFAVGVGPEAGPEGDVAGGDGQRPRPAALVERFEAGDRDLLTAGQAQLVGALAGQELQRED